MYAHEFMKKGGSWLGSLRTRVQTMFRNGDMIHWGSDEKVSHTPSIKELEELGSYAVAGYHREKVKPLIELLEKCEETIKELEGKSDSLEDTEKVYKLLNRICYELRGTPRFLYDYQLERERKIERKEIA